MYTVMFLLHCSQVRLAPPVSHTAIALLKIVLDACEGRTFAKVQSYDGIGH